jgi:hypothetical protein
MSFNKLAATESEINTAKAAEPAKSGPVAGPPEKPQEKTPEAETPSAKS